MSVKKLSRKKVFALTMFLWITDVICAAVLTEYAGLMTALLFGAIWTVFFGYLIWNMLKRLEK